jgi:hypothetical protein
LICATIFFSSFDNALTCLKSIQFEDGLR